MRVFVLLLTSILTFSLCGCNSNTTTYHPTTKPVIQASESTPEILFDFSQISESEEINSTIQEAVDHWIANELSEDASLELQHTILCNDERCISILFEGTITTPNQVYPGKVIFPITVSKKNNEIVDSFRYILANNNFLSKFEQSLSETLQSGDYSQEQQDAIISYLYNNYDGYLQILLYDKADAAITESGLLVILTLPHAIGDYLKVEIPIEAEFLNVLFKHESDSFVHLDKTYTLCDVSDYYELYCGEEAAGYYFKIFDKNGHFIDSGYHTSTTDISIVGDYIQLWYSAGMSNRMVKYYDIEKDKVSRLYNNPLDIHNELVVFASIVNNKECFIVQNIFDKSQFYQIYEMNPIPSSALAFEACFIDDTHIQISYLIANDETYTAIIDLTDDV